MPRPKRLRRLACLPPALCFSPFLPDGEQGGGTGVVLTMDEFEALRLSDLECRSQVEGASAMGVSRPTFGRIVESGRSKVARALVQGIRIEISGGSFTFGRGRHLQCPRCRCRQARNPGERGRVQCRRCRQTLEDREKPGTIRKDANITH